MNLRSIALVVGLVSCLALGVALLHVRTQRLEADTESAAWTAKNATRTAQIDASQAELRRLVSEHRKRRDLALVMISAEDRARNAVGPLVARLQQERAGQPPAPTEPQMPFGPDGSIFPELMGNLEYSTALHQVLRFRQSTVHRARLEQIGVPPETIEKALDLLTDREMVHWDVASLYPETARRSTDARRQEAQQRSAIADQIKVLLGEQGYLAFTAETTAYETRANADGTITRIAHQVRDIPLSRTGEEAYVAPLERRLSYTSEPLTPEQKAALADVYRREQVNAQTMNAEQQRANQPGLTQEQRRTLMETYRNRRLNGTSVPDDVLQQAYESILTPSQLHAVNELRAEQEASSKRAKLPKTASFH